MLRQFTLRSQSCFVASRQFSSASQTAEAEQLYGKIYDTAQEIENFNFRSYFSRRATEDLANLKGEDVDIEGLKERLAQMERIKTVQNLYTQQRSIIDGRQ